MLEKRPRFTKGFSLSGFVTVLACVSGACTDSSTRSESTQAVRDVDRNNSLSAGPGGFSASYSTQGELRLDGAFSQAQGTNGRSCVSCHVREDGWSIRPETVQALFADSDGLDPLFSRLDADHPNLSDDQLRAMSVSERRAVFSMLLQGLFTRSANLPATRNYDLTAVEDPFGISRVTDLQATPPVQGRMWFFRRPLATANFKSATVMWDAANTRATLRDGLVVQAIGNVSGAQQGPVLPASDPIIQEIVSFEQEMFNAQLLVSGVGRLDSDGATGGPEAHAFQPLVAGRFDLFDAWVDHDNPRRAQIARGQELFNRGDQHGRRCAGCHNAANSGQNVNGTLFNIGSSRPEFGPGRAVFTFTSRATETAPSVALRSTDGGRGIRNGNFADLNRFKVPSLRGLAARAPYFHNGIAATLADTVTFYERALGFDFTDQEEADLAAFMSAL